MAKAPGKRPPRKPTARRRARPKALRSGKTSRQERALADVARVLGSLGQPSAVIGGIAVIAWGYARLTTDIDCAIAAPIEEVSQIADTFLGHGFEERETDAVDFAKESFVLLLRHSETGIDIDVSLAQLGFELEALEAAVPREFGAVTIPIPRVTDLLIYKLVASRPKDIQDAKALLALGHQVDASRVQKTLEAFDEVLETDRTAEWLRLRRRKQ